MNSLPLNYENTWLWKYRTAIKNNEIRAGVDMITELDNLIDDWNDPEYIYDTRDADIRIDFIENCVKLTKSPFYGKPMILLLWQKALIEVAYSFKIKSLDTGEWVDRFLEILLLITRKNGKTELISALELAELFIGQEGSSIICSGTNDAIANLSYRAVDTMRLLIDKKQIDSWRNQEGIRCLYNNNMLYKLSDSSRNKEGRNVDMAGIDEVWALLDDGIYKPIQQSTSTKESYKIFMFGSEGLIVDGFLDKTREEYTKIIYKEDTKISVKRKLPWIYSQDSEQEVWDTDENGINKDWEKSNPSIGAVKKWSYLRDVVDEAKASKTARVMVLSKDFDFKVNDATSWLDLSDYDYETTFDLEDFRGCICFGGVDIAETTDMCSAKIMMMKPDSNKKYVHQMYWIPQSKLTSSNDATAGAEYKRWAEQGLIRIVEDSEVDSSLIADWFYELYKEYDIRLYKCGYDQKFSKNFLARMDFYGFEYEMVLQNRETMSTPIKLTETDFRHRVIMYNNNEIDKWCLKNASAQVWDTGHVMLVKIKGNQSARIDGSITFVILNEMYRRYRTEFYQAIGKAR